MSQFFQSQLELDQKYKLRGVRFHVACFDMLRCKLPDLLDDLLTVRSLFSAAQVHHRRRRAGVYDSSGRIMLSLT